MARDSGAIRFTLPRIGKPTPPDYTLSIFRLELGIYDAVNVGAAGTRVVRKPGLRAKFLAASG